MTASIIAGAADLVREALDAYRDDPAAVAVL